MNYEYQNCKRKRLNNSLNVKKILLKLIKNHREKLNQFFIFKHYFSHHFSGSYEKSCFCKISFFFTPTQVSDVSVPIILNISDWNWVGTVYAL